MWYCMVDEDPVNHVFGMQNRQTRNTIERRGSHKKIIMNPDDIRVGIIRMNNRIRIPVAGFFGNRIFRKDSGRLSESRENNDDFQKDCDGVADIPAKIIFY